MVTIVAAIYWRFCCSGCCRAHVRLTVQGLARGRDKLTSTYVRFDSLYYEAYTKHHSLGFLTLNTWGYVYTSPHDFSTSLKICPDTLFARNWPALFKRWIAMSTGKIAFQRISISETNCVIQWIEIYPVHSFIYLLNNQGRFNIFALLTRKWRTRMNFNLCIFKMASPTWVTTQPRLYRTNILGFTRRKQKRWFRNVDNCARQQHDTEIKQNRAGLWPSPAVSPFLWLISTA